MLTTSQKLSTGVDVPNLRNIVLLRPVNSMVEFKQIIGRGTRLFEGKDYFTLYDFVNAHQNFADPAWDGEPEPPEVTEPVVGEGPQPCSTCDNRPCTCAEATAETCAECSNRPCVCEVPPSEMITVELSDGTVRQIDSMMQTSFWSPDGRLINSEMFMQLLFSDLPDFFGSEEELREIWSLPDTRKRLLAELQERGYAEAQLEELRKLVRGQHSDLYDVLSYVAHKKALLPRSERAGKAAVQLGKYNPQQQQFLNFVLQQYIAGGVRELDDHKLPKLLELKYKSISDAKQQLGNIGSIRNSFIDMQAHLYREQAG